MSKAPWCIYCVHLQYINKSGGDIQPSTKYYCPSQPRRNNCLTIPHMQLFLTAFKHITTQAYS